MTISNVLQLMDRQLFMLGLIIYVMWHNHSFQVTILGSTESFLKYAYGFMQHHTYNWNNSTPTQLRCNNAIHSVHKGITL